MDLWYKTLGLCKQIKYLYDEKKVIHNNENDHECTMLYI